MKWIRLVLILLFARIAGELDARVVDDGWWPNAPEIESTADGFVSVHAFDARFGLKVDLQSDDLLTPSQFFIVRNGKNISSDSSHIDRGDFAIFRNNVDGPEDIAVANIRHDEPNRPIGIAESVYDPVVIIFITVRAELRQKQGSCIYGNPIAQITRAICRHFKTGCANQRSIYPVLFKLPELLRLRSESSVGENCGSNCAQRRSASHEVLFHVFPGFLAKPAKTICERFEPAPIHALI